MVNELMGWDFNFGFMKYGTPTLFNQFFRRAHRRLFHSVFHNDAAQLFRPKELTATHELLRRILRNPDEFMDHLRHMAGEIIMSVAYGINVLPKDDPYVTLAEHAAHSLFFAIVAGRFLVDSLPMLKYVPEWFPGASFRRKAKVWRELSRSMVDKPFAEAKRNIASSTTAMGNAPHSFTASALRTLDDCENKAYQEKVIKSTAGSMYTAGTDTTVSALGTFILAMLCNPEAQRKAQEEIDSVVQAGHLPDFDDEASLPYVSAVVKEVLRWRPVTPIAVPHFLPVDDEYRGYRLPAGSIVIANAWAILHDEPNPAVRNPDAAFGYGRRCGHSHSNILSAYTRNRVCPGRHMATSSIWIAVASILATFNITKAVGDDGQVIEPTHEYFPGLILMPLPFKCSIKPRSQAAAELIHATINETLV
ncbi:cytochrome P450 [Mycena vulgaris]|nr:cytochrome P450 [Mycena vulgaris]